jgi:hypothetical protein
MTAHASAAFSAEPDAQPPSFIAAAGFDASTRRLSVVLDPGAARGPLTVELLPPPGMQAGARIKAAPAGTAPVSVEFLLYSTDVLAGAEGELRVAASDGVSTQTYADPVEASFAALAVPANTLVCVPTVPVARVGEPVTFIFATGPTANPFQYLNLCTPRLPSDAQYVNGSADLGAPDPYPDEWANPGYQVRDGAWAAMQSDYIAVLGSGSEVCCADCGRGDHSPRSAVQRAIHVQRTGRQALRDCGVQRRQTHVLFGRQPDRVLLGDASNDGTAAFDSVMIN